MVAAAAAGNYQLVQQYMDVTNYADYMIREFYVGNIWDWKPQQNWMAARKREPGAGFIFFPWDADNDLRGKGPATPINTFTIDGHDANSITIGGPANLWPSMMQFPEFKMLVADRVQKFYFNGGIFTTAMSRKPFSTASPANLACRSLPNAPAGEIIPAWLWDRACPTIRPPNGKLSST